MWWLAAAVAWAGWPDLADPPRTGGGSSDAALVIGIEEYWAVPPIPGARANAQDWYRWFTAGRGTPPDRVQLLLDREATAEQITEQASRLAAQVGPEGTLWVVFIGHGAPDPSGEDALLLGADVQQTAQSLARRGVKRSELLQATAQAGERILVLDSCFSGRAADGEALAPGLQPLLPTWLVEREAVVELTAGRSDQFAGPLPGGDRPAFSYLLLGALQGWGDADGDGQVTAAEAERFAVHMLRATLLDRTQEPQRAGPDRVLSRAGRADAPAIDQVVARRAAPQASVRLPSLPAAPTARPAGIGVDVALEEQYWKAVELTDDAFTAPREVAASWCALAGAGGGEHAYAETAQAACAEWSAFTEAHASLWAGYAKDWAETSRLLTLPRAPADQKQQALDQMLRTYGDAELWSLRHVERARDRVAAGKSARLPALQQPPEWVAKKKASGGFLWGFDPLLRQTRAVQVRAGGGVSTAGSWAVDVQPGMALTLGPLDLGALNIGSHGDGLHLGYYAGLMPFAVRPSKRIPGELRGSMLNPIVGLGLRASTDATRWLDLYAANHFWFTNALGARLEYRQPLTADLPGQLTLGAVLNPAAALGR